MSWRLSEEAMTALNLRSWTDTGKVYVFQMLNERVCEIIYIVALNQEEAWIIANHRFSKEYTSIDLLRKMPIMIKTKEGD